MEFMMVEPVSAEAFTSSMIFGSIFSLICTDLSTASRCLSSNILHGATENCIMVISAWHCAERTIRS